MSPDNPNPSRSLADILGQSKPTESLAPGVGSSPLGSLLHSLASSLIPPIPPPIEGRWFKDQTIYVDGFTFERCRFDNCQIVTTLATFVFRDCFFGLTTRVFFDGPALKTAKLLMFDLTRKGRTTAEPGDKGIFPVVKQDGTITLE